MSNSTKEKFDKFLHRNPLHLREIRSPYTFNQPGDSVILVCNPNAPRIGNCRFFQAMERANAMTSFELRRKVEQAKLALLPSFNIDLNGEAALTLTIDVKFGALNLKIKITPIGNVRLIKRGASDTIWLHTGGESGLATMKLFEKSLFSHWKVSVVIGSSGNAILKLEHESKDGTEFELEGAIKPSKDGDGLVASVLPWSNKEPVPFGPLLVAGQFGFKVKITGDWKKWQEDNYEFTEYYLIDLSKLSDQVEEKTYPFKWKHVFIIVAEDASRMTVVTSRTLIRTWYWYAGLSWEAELGMACLAPAGA